MKRVLAFTLLLLLATAGLLGCARETVLVLPTAEPESVSFGATYTPAPSPPPPTPSPTPSPTPGPPADRLTALDGVYTFAWISDTQHYSQQFPDVYYEMTQFLYAERFRLNLSYVIHTGDLVNKDTAEAQWLIADGAMYELGELPYGVLAGNHDVGDELDYTNYCRYFGESRFAGMPWYGESYLDNRCHYDLIDAGGTSYIFVYAGYGVTEADCRFISDAFAAHPDRVGILCAHDYLTREGPRSEQGELLYERVVKPNANVYLVLCGHNYSALCTLAYIDDGGPKNRTVYQILGNYQAAGDEGGSGYMRFLQVDENAGELRMYTYSPLMKDYVYYDEPGTQQEKYAADPADETRTFVLPWL